VLLVEDDASLSEVVALILSAAGMDVVATGDGNEAVELARKSDFDLVVLDLMLPGRDGFEVCEAIRSWSAVPIIMLTARSEAGAIVRGLECGADDYVTKPFESAVLLARVRAILRRIAPDPAESAVLQQGDLRVDTSAFTAWKGDLELELSATEFRLLTEMVRHPGQVLTREVLLRRVWNYDYLGDSRLVDMAVKRLRDKIEEDPASPALITTVRGVGYRFERST
jgi:two-component system response regulator MtrA